jgi:hypothetical protein
LCLSGIFCKTVLQNTNVRIQVYKRLYLKSESKSLNCGDLEIDAIWEISLFQRERKSL